MAEAEENACIPILRALSDESRWRIVRLLAGRESSLTLGEIADALELSVYNASRHVKNLHEVGVVTIRRDGRFKHVGIAEHYRGSIQSAAAGSGDLDLGCCRFDFSREPGERPPFSNFQLRENATISTLSPMSSSPARYIMIGGFLGAGKTTAVAAVARHLSEKGHRVGLITNDQGRELVDTAMLRSRGFATEEIAGGCFCCRFNSLVDAAGKLTEEAKPDVFIAEPVGSCTDLVATVTYPLRRIYGEQFTVAPLSVLVDPMRARRILGLEEGRSFSEKVTYIYCKQLEEADVIVISKRDLIDDATEEELRAALEERFPGTRVLAISAREGVGMDEWFEIIESEDQVARPAMKIDYDIYAEGEALLGWLNATIEVTAEDEVDAGPLLKAIAQIIQNRLNGKSAEVAHLKMTLSPDNAFAGEVAIVNLVRNDYKPELCQELDEPITSGQIILNLRAECDPDDLAKIVADAVSSASSKACRLTLEHLENFRPGRPVPTHRDA
ncbi:MAG: helix-turn-helix domain-containing protein [Verrucomicrobiae bacterium]|nr:helix-turn-helix domain-containing protein [Verrucomicrobiae bacterium]